MFLLFLHVDAISVLLAYLFLSSFAQIHWFSIFNSFMMVVFLVGLVALILMRTLKNDYARFTSDDDDLDLVRFVIFLFCTLLCPVSFCVSWITEKQIAAVVNSTMTMFDRIPRSVGSAAMHSPMSTHLSLSYF